MLHIFSSADTSVKQQPHTFHCTPAHVACTATYIVCLGRQPHDVGRLFESCCVPPGVFEVWLHTCLLAQQLCLPLPGPLTSRRVTMLLLWCRQVCLRCGCTPAATEHRHARMHPTAHARCVSSSSGSSAACRTLAVTAAVAQLAEHVSNSSSTACRTLRVPAAAAAAQLAGH
jgi:hypothetical protein